MAFNAYAERANIMGTLDDLAGGRVWKTEVPGNFILPRDTNQRIRPYLLVRFARPFASARDRGIGNETKQPHIMPFTVTAFAGDPDSAELLAGAVGDKLVGWSPNGSAASPIKATGGYNFTVADTGSYPIRFAEAAFYTTVVNLSYA